MTRSKNPTIRDVARLAGVSRSTVSLVINGDPRISGETRARVLQVIEESGYEPNALARSLAQRRANAVTVVLPDTGSHVFTDLYFGEAISGVSSILASEGYRLQVQIANQHFIDNRLHLKMFREGGVDGILLLGTIDEDLYVEDLLASGTPVVLVNTRREGADSVVADNRSGAKAVIGHLVAAGHERIGVIGGLENTTVGADRSRGFREGLESCGLPFRDGYWVWGNFSEGSGEDGARQLLSLDPRPTAIVAANDLMAIGALRVAQEERKLQVPRDLAIAGADDHLLTTYVRPRLTTVAQPVFEIGRQAAEILVDRITGGGSDAPQTRVLPTRLVVRESTDGDPTGRS